MGPELQAMLYVLAQNENYVTPGFVFGMMVLARLGESQREANRKEKTLKALPHTFVIKGPETEKINMVQFPAERSRNGYKLAGSSNLTQEYIDDLLLKMEKELLRGVRSLPENKGADISLENFQIRSTDYNRSGRDVAEPTPFVSLRVSRPYDEEVVGNLLFDEKDPFDDWHFRSNSTVTRGYKFSDQQVWEMTGMEISVMPTKVLNSLTIAARSEE